MLAPEDVAFAVMTIIGIGALGLAALGIDWLLRRLDVLDESGWFTFLK